jgi:hypothetical protein
VHDPQPVTLLHQLRLRDVSARRLLTARTPWSITWSHPLRLRDVSAGGGGELLGGGSGGSGGRWAEYSGAVCPNPPCGGFYQRHNAFARFPQLPDRNRNPCLVLTTATFACRLERERADWADEREALELEVAALREMAATAEEETRAETSHSEAATDEATRQVSGFETLVLTGPVRYGRLVGKESRLPPQYFHRRPNSGAHRATRTTRLLGICPSFKNHSLSPSAKTSRCASFFTCMWMVFFSQLAEARAELVSVKGAVRLAAASLAEASVGQSTSTRFYRNIRIVN